MIKNAIAAVFQRGTRERQEAIEAMIEHAKRGGTIVFGSAQAVPLLAVIGRDLEHQIVVTRRATREDFLANCPAPNAFHTTATARFYWEAALEPIKQP